MKKTIFACLLAAGLFLFAAPAAAQDRQDAPNILLITIDTLRADHLSSYGYHLRTSPALDQLAAEGVRFDRAYTTAPYTGPAHVSLLTGRYPQEHGAKVNGQPKADDPRLVTLAQYLKDKGYRTAAFVSAWPLKSRLTGLQPGFDLYDEDFDRWYQVVNTYRSAEALNAKAIRWLQQRDRRPFFLWAHYFDPHSPFQLRKEFDPLPANPRATRQPEKRKPAIARKLQAYDTEIAYTDHHIGKLMDSLEQSGVKDSTLIVVTSDHGESFGEHNYHGHGRHLYEPSVRVPLIVRYPRAAASGLVVREPVSILDVAPTVLKLAGVEQRLPLPGVALNLRASTEDSSRTAARRPARLIYFVTFAGKRWQVPGWLSWLWYSDSRKRLPLRIGRVAGNEKVLWTPGQNRIEVFDLSRDAREVEPAALARSHRDHGMQISSLEGWFTATAVYLDLPAQLDKRDQEALKSLGYVAR